MKQIRLLDPKTYKIYLFFFKSENIWENQNTKIYPHNTGTIKIIHNFFPGLKFILFKIILFINLAMTTVEFVLTI